MEKWIFVGEFNCTDPAREEEFDHWHKTVHVQDVLETPGILRATRYEISEPLEGHGKYLAIYEVETEDIQQTSLKLGEIMTTACEQGHWSELLTLVHTAFYSKIIPFHPCHPHSPSLLFALRWYILHPIRTRKKFVS